MPRAGAALCANLLSIRLSSGKDALVFRFCFNPVLFPFQCVILSFSARNRCFLAVLPIPRAVSSSFAAGFVFNTMRVKSKSKQMQINRENYVRKAQLINSVSPPSGRISLCFFVAKSFCFCSSGRPFPAFFRRVVKAPSGHSENTPEAAPHRALRRSGPCFRRYGSGLIPERKRRAFLLSLAARRSCPKTCSTASS